MVSLFAVALCKLSQGVLASNSVEFVLAEDCSA